MYGYTGYYCVDCITFKYFLQLKSDIAVTKKETFTAEDNVANLEKVKKKQDLLIDSMNE